MDFLLKKASIFCLLLLFSGNFIQALEIERDGNYISSERVSVEEGGVYELSGRFTLSAEGQLFSKPFGGK